MCIHNLCFEQKYEKYQNFLSENFPFLVVKFSIYLNRHVFVMYWMSRIINEDAQKMAQSQSKPNQTVQTHIRWI